MATFTWFPNADHTKNVEPRITETSFGDAYKQRASIGLNPVLPTWDLHFTGIPADINPIDEFLRERRGVEAFEWKTPEEETGKFICKSWKKQRTHGVKVDLTATFEQVPE